jgi:hypothetical protein
MKKITGFFLLFMCGSFYSIAQDSIQYFITVNGNYYLPRNSDKQAYPVLGYDKDSDPKLLVGGFGAGLTAIRNRNEKFLLKAQANISRRAYWNDPIGFRDDSNNPLGSLALKAVDYVFDMTATAHYRLGEKVSIGTGLGVDVMLYSYTVLKFSRFEEKYRNGYYKPVMPVIPVELTFNFNNVLLNLRYAHSLLSRNKRPLSQSKDDSYSLLTMELGFRIQ